LKSNQSKIEFMKILKKQFRHIVLLFTLLILFQSCRVYHKKSVTLDQAVIEQKRVKIKTVDNKTLKFKKIIHESGEYYGIKPSTFMDTIYKIPLDQNKLQNIRMHNKTLSIIYGAGLSVVLIIIIGGYIIVASATDYL